MLQFYRALHSALIQVGLAVTLMVLSVPAQSPTPEANHAGASNPEGNLSILGSKLDWYPVDLAATPVTDFLLPFTHVLDADYVGSNRFVVSGWDEVNSLGLVLRITVQRVAGTYQAAIEEVVSMPVGTRANGCKYSPVESGLVLLDSGSGAFYFMPWDPSLPFNAIGFAMAVPTAGGPTTLDRGRQGLLGESADTVYGYSESTDWREIPDTRFRLYSTGGSWSADIYDIKNFLQSPTTSTGWNIKSWRTQATTGSIDVWAYGGGSFDIVRESDGITVLSGNVPAMAPAYVSFIIPPNAFSVTEAYQVVGAGQIPSSVFRPTYRHGALLEDEDLVFRPSEFKRELVKAGATFPVQGRIVWDGDGPQTATPIYYFLWARTGEPNFTLPGQPDDGIPDTIGVLPDGRMVMLNPAVTITGGAPAPITRGEGYRSLYEEITISGDPAYVGTPLLFQWLALTPQGNIIASEVFGAKVGQQAVAAASSTAGPLPPLIPGVAARQRLEVELRSHPRSAGVPMTNCLSSSYVTGAPMTGYTPQ